MSKRADGLVSDQLENRWSVSQTPTAGTTMTASVSAPTSAKSRHNLETLTYAISNFSATAHTLTMDIRAASVAGTAVWSQFHLVLPSTSAQVSLSHMGLQAPKGEGLFFMSNTVLASVALSVNAAGWTDTVGNG